MTPATAQSRIPPEATDCLVCRQPEVRRTHERWATKALLHCPACDVRWWSPVVAPGEKWYREHYYYVLRDLLPSDRLNWYHHQFLGHPPLPNGELLEIGCGTGNFLLAAQDRGFSVTGLELTERAVAAAQVRVPAVYALPLEQYLQRFPARQFDMVVSFEVLEHLPDPRQFLCKVNSALRPGGWVTISVPNRDRWLRRFGDQEWDRPPHHLTQWTGSALANCLRLAQFGEVVLTQSPVTPSGIAADLSRVVRFGIGRRPLEAAIQASPTEVLSAARRTALLYALKERLLTAAVCPLTPLLRAAGESGPTLMAAARKPVLQAVP